MTENVRPTIRTAITHRSTRRSLAAALVALACAGMTGPRTAAGDQSAPAAQSDATAGFRIYIDADFSVNTASAEAIEWGLRSALRVSDDTIAGRPVEVVRLDHRTNSRRSLANMKRALADPTTLAVVGGMHSPPLISHRNWINENELLVMVPWAAGAPITRAAGDDTNWIFRVSIDDGTAGRFMAEHALDQFGDRPILIAEESPWGAHNLKMMDSVVSAATGTALRSRTYSWDIDRISARELIESVVASKPSCVLFVGSASEAGILFSAIADVPESDRPAIISHWGILGTDFSASLDAARRAALDIQVIQTNRDFALEDPSHVGSAAWTAALDGILPEEIKHPDQLAAPTGFTHAHDLGRLLIAATEQAELTGDLAVDRGLIRDALESLERPVDGIVRRYERPFAPWSSTDPDAYAAHDALGPADYRLMRFDVDGRLSISMQSEEFATANPERD